jgi:tRNA-uridine 2-sulfurtransferase
MQNKPLNNKKLNKKPRVVVAMSGGVDSSVVAYLLKKEGYDVIGVFLKFWHEDTTGIGDKCRQNLCCDDESLYMAKKVASKLDIPFYEVNARELFKREIVDYYINEYESGRTPNPCVKCNRFIKFGYLWEKAKELEADFLATGHYVKKNKRLKIKDKKYGVPSGQLYRSKDKIKDQTYFLWNIRKEITPYLLFPLGDMEKSEVRSIAKKAGIPVFNKKDSQGVCFIPDQDNKRFLLKYAKKLLKPGEIVDLNGNVLGEHKGLAYYTIGQRENLGDEIGSNYDKFQNLPKGSLRENFKYQTNDKSKKSKNIDIPPLYVVRLDTKKNQLIIGENKDVFAADMTVEDVNIVSDRFEDFIGKNIFIQIRGGHKAEKAKLISYDKKRKKASLKFVKNIRAVTPGQSAVFYCGTNKELLGGGVII